MATSVLSLLEILGTFAFSVSGATLAIKKKFDVFGIFVLAFVTAIGGGAIRDIMIGSAPAEWMGSYTLISVIVFGAVLSVLFNPLASRMTYTVYLFDAIGLGFFTIAGIEKGISHELNGFICIALGTISATFGGLMRDIISGERPMLLIQKEIYAVASVLGGSLYFILFIMDVAREIRAPMAIIFIFLARHLTFHYKIAMPIVSEEGRLKW